MNNQTWSEWCNTFLREVNGGCQNWWWSSSAAWAFSLVNFFTEIIHYYRIIALIGKHGWIFMQQCSLADVYSSASYLSLTIDSAVPFLVLIVNFHCFMVFFPSKSGISLSATSNFIAIYLPANLNLLSLG